MASLIVERGRLRFGQQTFESTNYNAARNIQVMSVDDSSTALIASATTLGSPTNLYDAAFDATPTETLPATIVCVMTIPTGSGNFTIRRLCEHDDTAGNVTGSSTTLCSGVDAQALTKTSDFSLAITKSFSVTSV